MIGTIIKILSTKNLDAAIIQEAGSKGISIDCIPFIDIKTLDTAALQQKVISAIEQSTHVIFTSANAVAAVAQVFETKPRLKVFCISVKTKKLVEENFPGSIVVADAPNGAALAEKIIEAKIRAAAFFCGNKRLDTIPVRLAAANIALQEIVVYETRLTPHAIDKPYDAVLFFSPSAVESFFMNNEPAKCRLAFSFAASTYIQLQPLIKEIIVSHIPSEQGMLNAVIEYYKTKH